MGAIVASIGTASGVLPRWAYFNLRRIGGVRYLLVILFGREAHTFGSHTLCKGFQLGILGCIQIQLRQMTLDYLIQELIATLTLEVVDLRLVDLYLELKGLILLDLLEEQTFQYVL